MICSVADIHVRPTPLAREKRRTPTPTALFESEFASCDARLATLAARIPSTGQIR